MRTLFKYYSGLDKKYFIKPTIKISNATTLNDPFEKIVPEDLMRCSLKIMSESLALRGYNLADKEVLLAINAVNFRKLIRMIGVVSLTETPRNLLMWSHYANNHKGICVGYKSDFLDHHKPREHQLLPTEFTPVKVNYDDIRYDKNTENIDSSEAIKIRKEILKRSLLKKSNDWLYEKEYRSIIPLEYNDQITCINGTTADEYVKKYPKTKKINSTAFKIIQPASISTSPIYDEIDLMFTLSIQHKSIEYIYFGCESDLLNNIRIFHQIRKINALSHVKIFQMEANKNRFELNSILFEEYLETIKQARRIRHEE
ncbi:DUF2971 domain-containing protein [Aeromonas veronii]